MALTKNWQTRRHSKFQSVAIVIKGIRYWKENFSKTMGQFSIQKKQRPSKSVVLISIWFCIRHSCGLKQLYILKYFSSLILNKTNFFPLRRRREVIMLSTKFDLTVPVLNVSKQMLASVVLIAENIAKRLRIHHD